MRITYTAPNRSHHYPYVEALHNAGHLHQFISGFSRFSPRSELKSIGPKLNRQDYFQNLYLACLKFKAPRSITSMANGLSAAWLDRTSYKWARESDVFIYYRTEGINTTKKLHRDKQSTLCVMEEVNSHVEFAHDLLRKEHKDLNIGIKFEKESDFDLRVKGYEIADCILCPSEFVRRSFIQKGFPSSRIIKVNFGFPPSQTPFTTKGIVNDPTFRLLYVGQLHYRKGLRYAIEAFRNLKHAKKEFIIVGPKTSITGLEKTNIPDGVIFMGTLKGQALINEYLRASVFVLPSLEEGLALVQGEALSHGLPLLITTNTGGEDLISNGVEGFIVPPAEVKPLSDRLQQMADDKELLAGMAIAATQVSKKLGSWDVAAEILVTQLEIAMRNKSHA